MAQASLGDSARQISRNGLIGAPLLLMSILAMMVVPLPPFLLDLFFTFNIALSLIVILSGVYAKKPLDFAVFPTILLIATLLRLALNIASTRIVLLEGHTGTAAAGQVIEAFGDFVVGGNYAVGLVVFAILVIINFVVVTKGAGRISEVSARFTLDAMPGKQMAIDADLNAGAIDQDEAMRRRAEVVSEADFYGSMDGASKFVRGDAIAGILILFINIVGGLAIGMLQHNMAFPDAMHNYTLLTIGDGLVAQIPSLILSTAAAIMVTRVSSEEDMGQQFASQMFESPRALGVTAGVIGILGLIPGMPNLIFLGMAALAGGGAYLLHQRALEREALGIEPGQPVPGKGAPPGQAGATGGQGGQPSPQGSPDGPDEGADDNKDLSWDDVLPVDVIGLEVGYKLIPLVDKNQNGQLMARIKGIRKKLTQEIGFLIPPVHIRDNLELSPGAYRITLMGVAVGESDIYPDREMAINPGQVFGTLAGTPTKDPAFGMDAVWIDPGQRDQAQTMGYTVVDASTVVATHISQLLQSQAYDLLGREEVQHLLDGMAANAPKLVEGLVPDIMPLGTIQKVLRNLLEENISIRDMRTIIETLAVEGTRSQDPDALTAAVRIGLGRMIVQNINGLSGELAVISLDQSLEQLLQESMQGGGLEPGLAERIHQSLMESAQRQEMAGQPAVLVVSAPLRQMLAKFVRNTIPSLHVLSYNEMPDNRQIKIVSNIGRPE